MKLRTKLVALSLLTLLLPWSGWKLLQELEGFLRETQQGALLTSARTMASALPMEFRSRLMFLPELHVPLRTLQQQPALDGYGNDWPDEGQGLEFSSENGKLTVKVLAGSHDGRLYMMFDIDQESPAQLSSAAIAKSRDNAGITLLVRSPRGLFSFTIDPKAPGPLQLTSERGDSGQVEGYWLDHEHGYRVELSLPSAASNTDISFQVRGAREPGVENHLVAGPLADPGQPRWISLTAEWRGLSQWFARSEHTQSRTWLLDSQGWLLADSGLDSGLGTQHTTWLQRLLYRLVAGSRTELLEKGSADPVRLNNEVIRQALSGEEAISWTQDMDTAVVWNTVAVPVVLQDVIHGAIVMQSASDGLLLVTNRALGRLLITTLALTFGLAAGLWFFATRLSRRVQKLSGAVSLAMEDEAHPETLPLKDDRDELGELSRNNQKLLQAVADYNQYLQTLAGKLSHELKTPLAITRSSLDNLSSQGLDGESRRFLERAQEGVDRQAAIIRAMSEASRLEASIGVAEWETLDLASLVRRCAEGYRALHQGRRLLIQVPEERLSLHCAPDLLAQALDKLVDNAISMSGGNDDVTVILRFRNDHYELAVRNSGSRLPDELQDRLFDSLVSLREKRGAGPHLGLGLYIVRLVAAAHKGGVSAANLPAEAGVEFQITLPV